MNVNSLDVNYATKRNYLIIGTNNTIIIYQINNAHPIKLSVVSEKYSQRITTNRI